MKRQVPCDRIDRLSKSAQSAIADRVKWLRKERGITHERLSELSGLSEGHLGNIMSNRQANVRVETLCALSVALDVSMAELLGEKHVNPKPLSKRR